MNFLRKFASIGNIVRRGHRSGSVSWDSQTVASPDRSEGRTIEPTIQELISKVRDRQQAAEQLNSAFQHSRVFPLLVAFALYSFIRDRGLIRGSPRREALALSKRRSLESEELESENESSRWLRCVRPAVSVQGPKTEVRVLVHETSIFTTQRKVLAQNIIGADAV
jgi:hypothetical protein